MVQIVFIFLLLWALFGRRFGPSRSKNRTDHHSSMEYVQAIALLHKKAGTRAYALDSAAGWIKEEAKRLMIDKNKSLKKSFKDVSQSIKDKPMTDNELLRLTQHLYDDFINARNTGKG